MKNTGKDLYPQTFRRVARKGLERWGGMGSYVARVSPENFCPLVAVQTGMEKQILCSHENGR